MLSSRLFCMGRTWEEEVRCVPDSHEIHTSALHRNQKLAPLRAENANPLNVQLWDAPSHVVRQFVGQGWRRGNLLSGRVHVQHRHEHGRVVQQALCGSAVTERD